MSTAYPLAWPPGWPRTDPGRRESSRFKATVPSALSFLNKEISLLGGKSVVVSSNVSLGNDRPTDPGICVYFHYQGINAAIPCDRWKFPEDNLHAIAKTIEAMRGIERWGAKNMLKAAFTGFAALPAPGQSSAKGWREVLGFQPDRTPTRDEALHAYRILRSESHPDKPGGSAAMFDAVQRAWEIAQQEIR